MPGERRKIDLALVKKSKAAARQGSRLCAARRALNDPYVGYARTVFDIYVTALNVGPLTMFCHF